MALIIEILRGDDATVRHRVRVGPAPLSIGRGLDNDVILEDAYVDARHARVRTDESGNVVIEDLGSVNGLLVVPAGAAGPAVREAAIVAAGGTEVRLGRTILRFRDPAEPVPPALPDTAVADVPAVGPRAPLRRRVRAGLPVLAIGVIGVQNWLGSHARSSMADDVLPGILAFLGLAAIWSGIWAVAARIAVGRSAFGSHFAVVSAASVAGVAAFGLEEWLTFLIPSTGAWAGAAGLLLLAILAALIALHLRLASAMTSARCWRIGTTVSAILVAIGALAVAIDRDEFSDVPDFPGTLKPLVVRWPAPLSVEGFVAAIDDVRRDVDELATGTVRRGQASGGEGQEQGNGSGDEVEGGG